MKPPNIVYILSDDWGYGDVSCLNPESKINTPFTDALAREGTVFTDAHSNSAVCTPTRYGVLTGRYCWRSRLKAGVFQGYSRELIEQGRLTVPALLKQAGYRTACIGKWHLGLGWRCKDGSMAPVDSDGNKNPGVDFNATLAHGPHTVGFDYSMILPASLDMEPYCYIENGRLTEPATATCQSSPRPNYYRGGAIAPGMEHETCLLEFTRHAEDYIAQHAAHKTDNPFFMYLALPSPHTPHVPRKPFQGKSDCGTYGDYVVEHDWSIGQVMAALKRNGMDENTLVIVTSDNGAHMCSRYVDTDFNFERDFGHRSNHIFRGQKSDIWDGGHHIPFIARWPGHLPANTTCDQTICLTDLLATCAQITNQSLPPDAGEDSVSILPLLQGQFDKPTRSDVIHASVNNRHAIRQGKWKLIEGPGSGGWSLPDDRVPADALPMQLYDMHADPGETTNLAADHPQQVQSLLALLNEQRDAGRSVPLHG